MSCHSWIRSQVGVGKLYWDDSTLLTVASISFRSPTERKWWRSTKLRRCINKLRSSTPSMFYTFYYPFSRVRSRSDNLAIFILFKRPCIMSQKGYHNSQLSKREKLTQNTKKIVIMRLLQQNRGRNLGRGWDGSAKICLRLSCATKNRIAILHFHLIDP